MEFEDHRHCKVCGKPTSPGNEVCSNACRDRRAAVVAARRNYSYLLYGLIGFLLLLLVLNFFRI